MECETRQKHMRNKTLQKRDTISGSRGLVWIQRLTAYAHSYNGVCCKSFVKKEGCVCRCTSGSLKRPVWKLWQLRTAVNQSVVLILFLVHFALRPLTVYITEICLLKN